MTDAPTYTVEIEDDQWKAIQTFPETDLNLLLDFLKNYATRTPKLLVPGRLKALKGEYSGLY